MEESSRQTTNIVINFKTRKGKPLKFDGREKVGEEEVGILHLPAKFACAWVIDGQHRLYGYAYARSADGFKEDSTVLPILAYDNLSAEKEMNLFIDINSKQVKVNTGLLVELYSDLHWRSSDSEEAFSALLARIASRLNSDATSPLHERMVVTGKRKTPTRCITQTSVQAGLSVSKLLGTPSKGDILPGPLSTSSCEDYEKNLKKSMYVLSECLGVFSMELKEHWRLGDAPGGYLCTNNGIRALFHVLRDVSEHVRQIEGTDLCFLDASSTAEALRPYLMALVDYFKQASTQDFQAFRRTGSSLAAVRNQAYGMEAHISTAFPDFLPAGLKAYLGSRDVKGTTEADAKLRKIHERLFNYVVETLKNHFGSQDKAWWTKGIPLKIRQQCTNEWEANNRTGEEEENLYLINYIDICQENWNLVKVKMRPFSLKRGTAHTLQPSSVSSGTEPPKQWITQFRQSGIGQTESLWVEFPLP